VVEKGKESWGADIFNKVYGKWWHIANDTGPQDGVVPLGLVSLVPKSQTLQLFSRRMQK